MLELGRVVAGTKYECVARKKEEGFEIVFSSLQRSLYYLEGSKPVDR